MSTTSGLIERARQIACSPSPASPTTSMSSSDSRIILNPVLINAWSSTSTTLTLTRHRRSMGRTPSRRIPHWVEVRHGGGHREALLVRASRSTRGQLGHHLPELASGPSSSTSTSRSVSPYWSRTLAARRPRVLTGVGQCLLNDSIGRQLERRRKTARLTFDRQVHDQVCLARLGDQIVELGESRLGGKVVGITIAAKKAEEAMKLGDRAVDWSLRSNSAPRLPEQVGDPLSFVLQPPAHRSRSRGGQRRRAVRGRSEPVQRTPLDGHFPRARSRAQRSDRPACVDGLAKTKWQRPAAKAERVRPCCRRGRRTP